MPRVTLRDSSNVADLLSIIVPVYNEAGTVASVIDRLATVEFSVPREIIVVNDGSRDNTRAILDSLGGTHAFLTVVHSDVNRGKGHAVRVGLARSRGTVTAIQDADLELDPGQLSPLVDLVVRGDADVVYGSRFLGPSPNVPPLTYMANRVLTGITNALYGSSLSDMETCYKVMRGDVARGLNLTANRFDLEPQITARLLRRGHRIVERPITFAPRSRAEGKKIRWRDGVQAIRTLVRERFSS